MTDPDRVVVLGLGGNLGGSAAVVARFEAALARLAAGPLRSVRRAPLYRTAPVLRSERSEDAAGEPHPPYVNTVAAGCLAPSLTAALGPGPEAARRLVGWCKLLEVEAGRDLDAPRDSPRPLDLDLLLLGRLRLDLPAEDDVAGWAARPGAPRWPGAIIVPHAELCRRRFVLRPLCDLLPDLELPPPVVDGDGDGKVITVRDALAALDARGDDAWVEPLPTP